MRLISSFTESITFGITASNAASDLLIYNSINMPLAGTFLGDLRQLAGRTLNKFEISYCISSQNASDKYSIDNEKCNADISSLLSPMILNDSVPYNGLAIIPTDAEIHETIVLRKDNASVAVANIVVTTNRVLIVAYD